MTPSTILRALLVAAAAAAASAAFMGAATARAAMPGDLSGIWQYDRDRAAMDAVVYRHRRQYVGAVHV